MGFHACTPATVVCDTKDCAEKIELELMMNCSASYPVFGISMVPKDLEKLENHGWAVIKDRWYRRRVICPNCFSVHGAEKSSQ